MPNAPLTYSMLLEEQNRQVDHGEINPQTAANRASALRAFLRANHIAEVDVVGSSPFFEFISQRLFELMPHCRSGHRHNRDDARSTEFVESLQQRLCNRVDDDFLQFHAPLHDHVRYRGRPLSIQSCTSSPDSLKRA